MESLETPKTDVHLPAHLARLRDQERVELIMAFYRGLRDFRDLSRRSHAVGHRFHFDELDHLIEARLRPVKDMCHRLFRQSKRKEAERLLQAIFDMYFGILFHIMLKAKENLRLQENYNLQRLESLMKGLDQTREEDLPTEVRMLFDRITNEFERDSHELDGEIDRARFMLNQLEKVFNRIIQVYSDNVTIIRSLYAQKDFFAEMFPDEGVDRLFARIYPVHGPIEAYFFLGFDYLRSGHTALAEEVFSLALKAARTRRMTRKRLTDLFDLYRERTAATMSDAGEYALAFQARLREIRRRPVLRALVGHENDMVEESKRAGQVERSSRRFVARSQRGAGRKPK